MAALRLLSSETLLAIGYLRLLSSEKLLAMGYLRLLPFDRCLDVTMGREIACCEDISST
jgi:hypothetical protein